MMQTEDNQDAYYDSKPCINVLPLKNLKRHIAGLEPELLIDVLVKIQLVNKTFQTWLLIGW